MRISIAFCLVAELVFSHVALGAIVHVANDHGNSTGSTANFTIPVSATGLNNLMVVGVSLCCSGTIPTITDNKSNTWTAGTRSVNDGANDFVVMYYAWSTTAGVTTINVAVNGQTHVAASFGEFSGIALSGFDGQNTKLQTSATSSSGNITPTISGDLLVAVGYDDNQPSATPTAGTGFSLMTCLVTPTQPMSLGMEYRIYTSTAATAGTMGWPASDPVLGGMMAFKAAAISHKVISD